MRQIYLCFGVLLAIRILPGCSGCEQHPNLPKESRSAPTKLGVGPTDDNAELGPTDEIETPEEGIVDTTTENPQEEQVDNTLNNSHKDFHRLPANDNPDSEVYDDN